MKRVVVTGAQGLLGWHASARLHAQNCGAGFRGEPAPFDLVRLDRAGFEDDAALKAAVTGADLVLHYAGQNRGDPAEVEAANPAIAQRLVEACRAVGAAPHIVYANSTHAAGDTPYGRGKAKAADVLAGLGSGLTNVILPHIFGEAARPHYNNVTATLIDAILKGETPELNPDGRVSLLHAGDAVQIAIDQGLNRVSETVSPAGRDISVMDLFARIKGYHDSYTAGIYPDFSDPFDVALFNSYREASYPGSWPRPLKLNTDARGTLFEAVKGGGGGQTFLSTTEPGVTRGDHFHLHKVERFLVVQGEAVIRLRKALTDEVYEYHVSGSAPAPVDMPTLYTHSIENTGTEPLLTLFWTHDLFDPQNPDTYFDKVLA